jgi:hypothetical protein
MNQKVEMTGTQVGCMGGKAMPKSDRRPEDCMDGKRSMASMTEVFSRAIVRKASADGVLVLAVTDSIRTSTSPGKGRINTPVRIKSRNDAIELRVSSDGGAEVIDSEASDELRALFGQMPATLSRKPVSVGDSWDRQMRIPIAGESGAYALVRATFRLDSLGRGGDIAFISMQGTLAHDHRDGSDSELSGSMNGFIQLNRRLGWITDTRVIIDANSIVQPAKGGTRMQVRTRVTQSLHAGPAR